MGRSRDLKTEIEAVRLILTSGQARGAPAGRNLGTLSGGVKLIAGTGNDTSAIRDLAVAHGASATNPPCVIRTALSGKRVDEQRGLAEGFLTRINHFRGVARRGDCKAENVSAALMLV
ncbi:MAG: hypothetical protein AAGI50_03175 [Pseudomonadota bacterium]